MTTLNVRQEMKAIPPNTTRAERSRRMRLAARLAPLHTPHRRRKFILFAGVTLVTLDLCALPITYYYALKFGTNLKLQDIFAIITAVYGMMSFTHYSWRSWRLFRTKSSETCRPLGWKGWGLFEFLHINVLIIITLVEIELIAGTAPSNPIVRLCAMPSPTICFYLGFLFCGSAILTQLGVKLPFNMSSTPKGTPWRPALVAFIEDAGSIEGRGGQQYRENVLKRYEASPIFRHMVLVLTWFWGIGLLTVATIATALIMTLSLDKGFGVGWGLPWVWAAVWIFLTMAYVKKELRREGEQFFVPKHQMEGGNRSSSTELGATGNETMSENRSDQAGNGSRSPAGDEEMAIA